MKFFKPLLYTILILGSFSTFGHAFEKKDTVYYLVDTAKIPINDRMLVIEVEGRFKLYVFNIVCLKYDRKPAFYYDRTKMSGEIISQIKDMRFISLPALISLAQEGGGDLFNTKHVAYFIEPEKDHFKRYRVELFKPQNKQVTIN